MSISKASFTYPNTVMSSIVDRLQVSTGQWGVDRMYAQRKPPYAAEA